MFFKKLKNYIKSKKITITVLAFLVILTCLISLISIFNTANPFDDIDHSKFSIDKNDKIIIFSPHPDDETVPAGGLIQKAKEKNASVLVVCITDGSASMNKKDYKKFLFEKNLKTNKTLPEMRNQELIESMHQLGLNDSNIICLGYPDTGIKSMFETNWYTPYNSKTYFNSFNESHYNFSYTKNVEYSGKNLDSDLKNIINDFNPTIVVYPYSNDVLPDHSATNAFVTQALIETNYNGMNYTYIVHTGDYWPTPHFYFPWGRIKPPLSLLNPDIKWESLDLNSKEINNKIKAVNKYQTQLYGGSNYLLSFLKTNEIFIKSSPIIIDNRSNTSNQKLDSLLNNNIGNYIELLTNEKLNLNNEEIGVFYDKNNLNIILKSNEDINENITYLFSIRKFNNRTFDKIDISIKNNTLNCFNDDNNTNLNQAIKIKSSKRFIKISIPLDIFEDKTPIMINFKMVDFNNTNETGWKEFRFN